MRKHSVRILSALIAVIMIMMSFAGCQKQDKADDIVILFTNDVHCAIDENIGYAGLASYVKYMESQTPYVTLVDCGDAIDGDFIGTVSEGEYIVDIMNEIGYDFALLGNHEFGYGMDQLEKLIEKSKAEYLGCNITYIGSGENALKDVLPSKIVEYGDVKVAFIGVSTPNSLTSTRPSNFQENGEYVYGFMGGDDGKELTDCVQKNIDECRKDGADYVVLMTHLGDDEESYTYSSAELLKNTTGVDAVLDGHAHNEVSCRVEQNKEGKNVLLSSSGTELSNIGQLVITTDGTLSVGLVSDYRLKDEATVTYIGEIKAKYEKATGEVLAKSDTKLTGYTEDGIRLVRNRETTIGNFCADAYRIVTGADVGIINGGGIRADLPAGNITYADMLAVHPYGNMICVVEVSGQEILDCLEMASSAVMNKATEGGAAAGEAGRFLQVSGIKYTVDTSVVSSVKTDENGMFVSVDGARRVSDVKILDKSGEYKALDPKATYTLASHNYLIKSGGDGMNMFVDNKLVIDEGIVDYQILITYITENLGGKLGDKYSKAEGRITIN